MTKLVMGLVLVPVLAYGGACRPTGRDVTVFHPKSAVYANFRGQTATQNERECLESFATLQLVKLVASVGDLAPEVTARAVGTNNGLTTILTRIQSIPPYRGALQQPSGGRWIVNAQGRNYQGDWTYLNAFRTALMDPSVRDIAATRLTPDQRLILNVNEDLTDDAGLPNEDVEPDYHRDDLFPIDTTSKTPIRQPCATGDCSLLEATHKAHACSSQAFIDGTDPTVCESTSQAHFAYENQCGEDQNCQWFRRIRPFPTTRDGGWSLTEQRQWTAITDVLHHAWAEAERRGDPKASELASGQHLTAHVCLAVGTHPKLRVVLVDERLEASDASESYGGDQSCRALLPQLVARYGITVP